MSSLINFVKKDLDNIITPFGQIDVLLLYGIVAGKLKKYLNQRELGCKIWLPAGKVRHVLKRGSKLEPLFIDELEEAVTVDFLEIRSKKDFKSAKDDITGLQEKVWKYFVPRKLADFFYATNTEGVGKQIDRIFFDLDRTKGLSAENAQEVTKFFIQIIEEDEKLNDLLGKVDPFVYWTGNSFHVFIFMEDMMPSSFYDKHFQYSKDNPETSFTGRWAKQIDEQVEFKVIGGHERHGDSINIDPSQTPSGKLCRVPLGSLHMSDAKTVDGVSIPLKKKMLDDIDLAMKLVQYKPKDIVKNLEEFAKRLPKRFR